VSASVRAALALALLAAGCVDVHRCHDPVAWRVCDGEHAQPGAGGTPPTIEALVLPTCANLDAPTVSGELHVSDPDGDAQRVLATLSASARLAETETQLDDAGRRGNDWQGTWAFTPTQMQRQQGSYRLRVKVTDRAGNQSAPLCSDFALIE
jgi:hypothetical protein